MTNRLLQEKGYTYISHVFVCLTLFGWVFCATWIGWKIENRLLLPLLQTVPVYGFMVYAILKWNWKRAFGWMLVWALALALVVAWFVARDPVSAEHVIIKGTQYRTEMVNWLCTGYGMEVDPARFIPHHLKEIFLFIIASLLTASFTSMIGGTVLMNYMGAYVGYLMHYSDTPVVTFFIGWKIYAVIRVISYVMLGVLLAEPLLFRLTGRTYTFKERKWPYIIAFTGLFLDITLKIILAPHYGEWLRVLTHLPCS